MKQQPVSNHSERKKNEYFEHLMSHKETVTSKLILYLSLLNISFFPLCVSTYTCLLKSITIIFCYFFSLILMVKKIYNINI